MSPTLCIWWITSTIRHEGQQLTKPIQGYVRTGIPLNVLETTVERFSTNPLAGVLEISTEDGVLRLAISGDAAKDLRIDLDQFLAENQD